MNMPKWNFPTNNYADENGLDTSDMETFKKDPMASLAREICQNSVDASNGKGPVVIRFSLFDIPRENIPGIEDLTDEIAKCYEYKKDSSKEAKTLKSIYETISKPIITCMRISDFNTTGIDGVSSNERGRPFYNLTRGSGVSDKQGASGGSKGIGKYASFVVSGTNTVFYSTLTSSNEKGYIGISRLRSIPVGEQDPDLMTLGTGYFGEGNRFSPVLTDLKLDPDFKREDGDFGTDIYLIGFNHKKWKEEIVVKVLDSFMVAVYRGKLEVFVDDIEITKTTLRPLIENDEIMKYASKYVRKDIAAQYELISEDEGVTKEEIEVAAGETVTIYMKKYSQQAAAASNKRCVMVRYPYMKIRHYTAGVSLPFSAMCVIEDNSISRKLRNIENPQHTDWEIKRLDEFPDEKKETKQILNSMRQKSLEYVREQLRLSSSDSTDMVGAGEFLPSQDDFGNYQAPFESQEDQGVSRISISQTKVPQTLKTRRAGESLEHTKGEKGADGANDDGVISTQEDNPSGRKHDNDKASEIGGSPIEEGGKHVIKRVPLSGIRPRIFAKNQSVGLYTCKFVSPCTEDNCTLQIKMFGEAADTYPVRIKRAFIDDAECKINNGIIVGLKLVKDQAISITYEVERTGLFASEVIVNAYR